MYAQRGILIPALALAYLQTERRYHTAYTRSLFVDQTRPYNYLMPILAKAIPVIALALLVYLSIRAAQWLYARYPSKTQRDRLIFVAVIVVAVVLVLLI